MEQLASLFANDTVQYIDDLLSSSPLKIDGLNLAQSLQTQDAIDGHKKFSKFEYIKKSSISSIADLSFASIIFQWIAANLPEEESHTFLQYCNTFLLSNPKFEATSYEETVALEMLEKSSDPWQWALHAFQGGEEEDIQDAIVQLILRYYQGE